MSLRIPTYLPSATFESIQLVFSYYKSSKPDATFVQVGACDGKTDDAVNRLLANSQFKSVLVEPIPMNYRILENDYSGSENVFLLNAAVGVEDGRSTIYSVRNTGRWKDSPVARQWASFNRSHLLKHGVKPGEIEEVDTEVVTIDSIRKRFGLPKIDILLVDAEGFDFEIVEMAVSSELKPDCIYFEYIHIKNKMRALAQIFKSAGYRFSYDKWNALAISQDLIDQWESPESSNNKPL